MQSLVPTFDVAIEVVRDKSNNSRKTGCHGLPRCLSDASLFRRNALPLKNISLEFKLEKTRQILELRQLCDQLVRNTGTKIWTRRAWKADAVDNAIVRLKRQELIGRIQQGRSGLDWGDLEKFWSKASKDEHKRMVVTRMCGDKNGGGSW